MDALQRLSKYPALASAAAYAVIAFALVIAVFTNLFWRSRHLRAPSRLSLKRLILFSTLAVVSLASIGLFTYYHGVQFYQQWLRRTHPVYRKGAMPLPPLARLLHALGFESLPEKKLKAQQVIGGLAVSPALLEQWLSEPLQLQKALEAAIATPARFWWALQLLLILPGWSLFVGWQGRRYRVPHIWAYMLLAQGLSVAFAINVFFVALILSPISIPIKVSTSPVFVKKTKQTPDLTTVREEIALRERMSFIDTSSISESKLVSWSIYLSVISAMASIPLISAFVGTNLLLPALAIPHLLLFLPTLLPTMNPEKLWSTYKALFIGILLLQSLAMIAIVGGYDVPNLAASFVFGAESIVKACGQFASDMARATLIALEVQFGFPATTPYLERVLPVVYRNDPLAQATAAVDHLVRLLNSTAVQAWSFLSSFALDSAEALRKDPLIIASWASQGMKRLQTAVYAVAEAPKANPVVGGIAADAALAWISAVLWVSTAAALDDEMAEESVEPVLEAQETIKGLSAGAGGDARAGVPAVRTSWFESHIG